MAITSTGLNAATNAEYKEAAAQVDKSVLGKDDFMTLLLVELQHQDPTEPMDSEKILTQTSQLATLEASENTNKALEDLAASLGSSQQYTTIAAIGKTADLGSNAIGYDEGGTSSFEVYFPQDVESGVVEILNVNGEIVSTMNLESNSSGVYQFDWDGTLSNGNLAESGMYYITASYKNPAGDDLTTRMGAYPIESVRFEDGAALVKVGSSYVDIENVVEIY
ncbi:MAG: FlgD immunoglobulin-like domain containing protein [Campylobacterota bacterium]|nr:FlgD immunoglobulin-like domain containing protein [Campylobacterota bacterium]